jgi:DNA modification methylase
MEPTWQSDDGRIQLWHGDGVSVSKVIKADACITDPPYGMNNDTDNSRFSGGNTSHVARRGNGVGTNGGKPIANDDAPFDPSPFLGFKHVALWGSHHFSQRLPVGTTLVWIKKLDPAFGSFLSDAELAWVKGGCGVYCRRDLSMTAEARNRLHTNQKPIAVMAWCMDVAKVPQDAVVFDPYMGSGTVGVVCIRTGRRYIGVEIDAGHFDTAKQRIIRELAQPMIPGMEPQAHTQPALL